MAKIKIEKPKKVKTNKIEKEIKKKSAKSKATDNKVKLILKEKPTANSVDRKKINEFLVNLAIEGLFKLTKETVSKKLFDDDYPILLQVTVIKIPSCADRVIRLPLQKSLLTDTSEVCLIVPDLKRGRKVDYEPTVEHYENLLRENKISYINKVIPMNAIKTEYDQFELKRRLVGSYDYFLADGRISGHLTHLLGKVFYSKRKLPTPVHLSSTTDMKKTIDDALNKTQMHIHANGNTFVTQVGHAKMTIDDITTNVLSVAESLGKILPGGWNNIRSLHLKTHLSIAIPIYMTLKSSNDIKTPKASKKPKLNLEVEGTLSTLQDADIKVLPSGEVIIPKFAKQDSLKNKNKTKKKK